VVGADASTKAGLFGRSYQRARNGDALSPDNGTTWYVTIVRGRATVRGRLAVHISDINALRDV
jgi:hypothetical protein